MTGYGRDTLGELCLLSFMTTQTPSRGIDFIIFMGRTKGQKENPELDLKTLVKEGREIGQSAEWMLFTRWEDRLHEPLAKCEKSSVSRHPRSTVRHLKSSKDRK